MSVEIRKPGVDAHDAERLLREAYGIAGVVAPLAGERDATFSVDTADGGRYVLKIAPAGESAAALSLEVTAVEYLASRDTRLALPRIVRTAAGAGIHPWRRPDGETHHVRLFTWIDGEVWARVRPHTAELRRSLGTAAGRLRAALDDFEHPAAHRDFVWDLTRPDRILPYTDAITDASRREKVEAILSRTALLVPRLAQLRQSVLYHDANDWNVIVAGDDARRREVTGFVDFGDMLAGPAIIDLALAVAYGVMDTRDPLRAAADIVTGYHGAHPLAEAELAVLLPLVRARLAFSVTFSAARARTAGADGYLGISAKAAWTLLDGLAGVHDRFAEYVFRDACGLEPCPSSPRIRRWLARHLGEATPVLDIDSAAVTPPVIDLSIGSGDLGTPADLDDLERTSHAIERRVGGAGAGAGIGRWNEVRAIYRADAFRAPGNERDEYRTVHIGLDLFAPPGTSVRAPLDGVVHSFRNNVGRYDYGPAILLEHRVRDEDGELVLHTLYGHLSAESLGGVSEGEVVRAGTVIGSIGDGRINGGWPPHVHLQVIADTLGQRGTYPGVAGIADRAVWLSLSPDPGALAGLAGNTQAATAAAADAILEARRARIGPSLSISYGLPLHIVRGFMQTLYDAGAQPYLDGVNNVAHVGHCHPRVVAAAASRKAVLETNTRYLHEDMVRLAERLGATLPDPLEVCFFVNSGSEANELALRLARTGTGNRGVVVLDVGYHGNTTTLIDVSPYKHDGEGGGGAPPWVRKIPLPDPYRGSHRGEPDAGRAYAMHVSDAVAALRSNGEEPAALLAESILSCGGQVVPPSGFLAEAYTNARAAGALCIADEVQTGLGRVGEAFWAFELEGVVPDIVTIGKPFGNGHPLAAVVTTRTVADAFANGMEYFNTFGGNTVSCAVGLAVLDVIEEEGLQRHALATGAHLLAGLRGLMARHPIIGDVRGRGLFLGFELVEGREARTPAPAAAGWLVERARDRGVLLSTDGPDHNVIKIKPPLCFDAADADRLLGVVDDVLAEDFFRR